MYEPDPIIKAAQAQSFKPFVLELTNGEQVTIRHPDFIWVRETDVLLAEEAEGRKGMVADYHIIGLDHVVQVKQLGESAVGK